MGRSLSWSKKAFGTIVIFGLVVSVSLSIVAQSGCAKKSAETKPRLSRTATKASDPSSVDLSEYVSSGGKVMKKLFADVNKDGNKEIIFLSGKDAEWQKRAKEKGFEWMKKVPPYYEEVRIRILTWDGSKYTSSWEHQTIGEVGGELWAEDINKDSIVEILSKQAMGAGSVALYVVAWNGSSYDLLKPMGPAGANPKDFFGPKGAKVKDDENDGVKEIYSHYGPAGSQADIYKWDGKNYTYSSTVSFPIETTPRE